MKSSTCCQGIALKYEEEFKLALESFAQASALDPTWQEPRGQEAVLVKYLQVVIIYLYLLHLGEVTRGD